MQDEVKQMFRLLSLEDQMFALDFIKKSGGTVCGFDFDLAPKNKEIKLSQTVALSEACQLAEYAGKGILLGIYRKILKEAGMEYNVRYGVYRR